MDDLKIIGDSPPEWLANQLRIYQTTEYVAQSFSDSTHKLWRLGQIKQVQENHFLKVCHHVDTPFWQVMSDLFDYDLPVEISSFSQTYGFIDSVCSLDIPKLIRAERVSCSAQDAHNDILDAPFENNNAYILTTELTGSVVKNIDNDEVEGGNRVKQLAIHLAELHTHTSPRWGSLSNPKLNANDWPKRLEASLLKSAKKWGGVFLSSEITSRTNHFNHYLTDAVNACAKIEVSQFIPMIPDLRWDQFFQVDRKMTALLDLDAFVFAPRELDFVILEYLLLPNQVEGFTKEYMKYHAIPDIKNSRNAYRLLLFFMQILGEKNLDKWMNTQRLF